MSNIIVATLKCQVYFVISVDVENNSMQPVTLYYHEVFTPSLILLVQNLLCWSTYTVLSFTLKVWVHSGLLQAHVCVYVSMYMYGCIITIDLPFGCLWGCLLLKSHTLRAVDSSQHRAENHFFKNITIVGTVSVKYDTIRSLYKYSRLLFQQFE